jgi:hypothetical protein
MTGDAMMVMDRLLLFKPLEKQFQADGNARDSWLLKQIAACSNENLMEGEHT